MKLNVLTRLVTTLSESLFQQHTKLKEIKAQNDEIPEEVRALQGNIGNYFASLPSTLLWAPVAARQQITDEGNSVSWTTSIQNRKKEPEVSSNQHYPRRKMERPWAISSQDSYRHTRQTHIFAKGCSTPKRPRGTSRSRGLHPRSAM